MKTILVTSDFTRFLALLFLVGWSQISPAQSEERVWTNQSGTQITAKLVSVEGNQAVLEMNGTNYPVPIATLSPSDQSFISDWMESSQSMPASAAGGTPGVEPNWDAPWPRMVSVSTDQEIETVREDDEKNEYVYTSPHYEFISDVKLNTSVIKRFSVLFEATNQYCRELPLGLTKAFRSERHQIFLFEKEGTYRLKGGPPNTSGVYISRDGEGVILVPLTSLGVKKVGSNYSIDHSKENTTIAHEITHQLTDKEYFAPEARGWFTEGLAEYVAQSGYRSGKFSSNDLSKIKEYVTSYGSRGQGGRALGTEFSSPPLRSFMNQSYDAFKANGMFNYGMSLLLAYYFFHMDGDKDAARVKTFLQGLKEGKTGDEAFALLLDGRSWQELQDEVTQNWRSRGIRINFQADA